MRMTHWKIWGVLVCQFCCGNFLMAQTDTILNIPSISITSTQIKHFENGRSIIDFDSTQISHYSGLSLGDILSNETGVFIKSLSPGNLSTPSIRGTGFGHVAVLWNGFPIQSPMNGGIDFSIFSVDSYQSISLIKGGNSSIYGSGAIGGTISLENNLRLNQGWNGAIVSNVNTNKDFGFHGKASFSTDILAFGVNLNYQNNRNEYRFGKKRKIQKDAHHLLESQSVNFLLKLTKNQFLKCWTYFDKVDRDISPSRVSAYNGEKMRTSSNKVGLEWSLLGTKSKQTVRIGYFQDSLNFMSNSIDSKNRTDLWIGQLLSKHFLKNNIKWEWGLNEEWAIAQGNNIVHQTRNQVALFSNLSYGYQKWNTSFSIRQAFLGQEIVPITFTWGHQFRWSDNFLLLGNISRNYRAPTFNDLYWPGLGNPNLKSEKGWSGEFGFKIIQSNWSFSSTYYGIVGKDWIVWSPNQSGLWMPHNNLKIVSQGVESGFQYQKRWGEYFLNLSSFFTYTRSVLKENYSNQSDADIGKQLIYVPKFKANISVALRYKSFDIRYQTGYTSSVRTIQKQLDGYFIGNVALGFQPSFWKKKVSFHVDIANIGNKNYEVVAYYPMPLRFFAFRVKYAFD